MNKQQLEEILNNAPEGATHVDSFEYEGDHRYLNIAFSQVKSADELMSLNPESDLRSLSDLQTQLDQLNEIERLRATLELARKHVGNEQVDLDGNGNNFVTVKSVIDDVLEGE